MTSMYAQACWFVVCEYYSAYSCPSKPSKNSHYEFKFCRNRTLNTSLRPKILIEGYLGTNYTLPFMIWIASSSFKAPRCLTNPGVEGPDMTNITVPEQSLIATSLFHSFAQSMFRIRPLASSPLLKWSLGSTVDTRYADLHSLQSRGT